MTNYEMLIGTYTRTDASDGIYAVDTDGEKLSIKASSNKEVANPTYLLRDGNNIYTIESNDDKSGGVGSYHYENGTFTFVNKMITDFAGPCHIDLDKTKQYIVTSHYHAGKLELHKVDNGKIIELTQVVDHKKYEDEANPKSHVHFAKFTKDNKYIIACDLGLDKVVVYPFDAEKGLIDENGMTFYQTTLGSGPRHFALNEAEDKVYVINELSGSLLTLGYSNGLLELLSEHFADSLHTHEKTGDGSAIRLHPNGKFLYVSLRSSLNSIVCYKLDSLEIPQYLGEVSSNGDHPRDFNITADGKYMIVANQNSNNIVTFAIEEDGRLKDLNESFELPQPVCVVL